MNQLGLNGWTIGVGLALLLLSLEVGLRAVFGFGRPLLYQADPQIGYLLVPHQQTRRFGNLIQINAYSMRSAAISPTPADRTLRLLMVGDSIVNGGWWTDQTATLSAKLQAKLAAPAEFDRSEVLNASANSWSPRNQLAYLQRFGTFQAQRLVLVINTDDLFGSKPSSQVVGADPNYPDRRPAAAIVEVVQRYVSRPALPRPSETGDLVGANLAAIAEIQAIAQAQNAQFLLVITPLLREVEPPGGRDYEQKARQRLKDFTAERQIKLVDMLPLFQSATEPAKLYRDSIHLSDAGSDAVVQAIVAQLEQ